MSKSKKRGVGASQYQKNKRKKVAAVAALAPTNLLQFLGVDEQNVLVSVYNLQPEINLFENVNLLFDQARAGASVPVEHALVHQLMSLTHYHLFFSFMTLCRCHPEEAFASMRVAIEATLNAYRIILGEGDAAKFVEDEKQGKGNVAFIRRQREKDPEKYALAEDLLKSWDFCSAYGSHADYKVVQLKSLKRDSEVGTELLLKFVNDQPIEIQKFLALTLCLNFCLMLEVFSGHLLNAVCVVDEDWERRRKAVMRAVSDSREKIRGPAMDVAAKHDPQIDALLGGGSQK